MRTKQNKARDPIQKKAEKLRREGAVELRITRIVSAQGGVMISSPLLSDRVAIGDSFEEVMWLLAHLVEEEFPELCEKPVFFRYKTGG